MANVLGCRLADRIVAIAPVSGLYGPGWEGTCVPARPVPVIAFHGVMDPIVPYAGGTVSDPEGRAKDFPAVVSVESWAAGWAKRDSCDSTPMAQPSIGHVQPLFWQGCRAPVELYKVADGSHTWPGMTWHEPNTNRDISATDMIWEFFASRALAPGT